MCASPDTLRDRKGRIYEPAVGAKLKKLLLVLFAVIASFLISIPGILFIGGVLLSWVCWRFFKEIRKKQVAENSNIEGVGDGEA